MSREKACVIWAAEAIDIGNAASNVSVIPIPFKCEVLEAIVVPLAGATNSFTVGFNYYDGTNAISTNAFVGSIVVADSAAADVPYYDAAGLGVVLEKHSRVMIDCDEAGDSGETALAGLVVNYLPETDANDQSGMIETA